jgi:serine O-acetyltransferase
MPVVLIRLSQYLYSKNFFRLSKLVSLINFQLFKLEVSSKTTIGKGLVIPHTLGIVLGAAKIGRNVTIYQQVTVGAKHLDFNFAPHLRPIIGDNVTLGSGCKVLGSVIVSDNSIVGANSVVVKDVPPGHLAIGVPAVYRLINV